MTGKKRGSPSSGPKPTPTKHTKKGHSATTGSYRDALLDEDGKEVPVRTDAATQKIIQAFHEHIHVPGKQVFQLLNSEFPTEAERIDFAKWINEHFEEESELYYMRDSHQGGTSCAPGHSHGTSVRGTGG